MKNCAHIQQHSKAQNNHTSQCNEDALCIHTTLKGSTTRKHCAHTQQHSKQSCKSIQGSTMHTYSTLKTIIQANTRKHYAHTQQHSKQSYKSVQGCTKHTHNTQTLKTKRQSHTYLSLYQTGDEVHQGRVDRGRLASIT